jgi:hypothetical protein
LSWKTFSAGIVFLMGCLGNETYPCDWLWSSVRHDEQNLRVGVKIEWID